MGEGNAVLARALLAVRGNQMTLPKSMKIDPEIVRLKALVEEDNRTHALYRRNRTAMLTIAGRFEQGMSRKRLVEIYGADLVNEVLGSQQKE